MNAQKPDGSAVENTVRLMRRVLFGGGALFTLVGIIRQWPVLGKSYVEFIEGDGYLGFIMGLIMIVLGFSAPLLIDETDAE